MNKSKNNDETQEGALELSLDGLSVMIGMPTHRDLHPRTVKCLLETIRSCDKMGIPIEWGLTLSGVVTHARDDVADKFLNSSCNRLFWIDSDMTWTFEQFMRMLALSQKYPVLCAAYPAKIERTTFFIKYDEYVGLEIDSLGLAKIQGAGLGFTVVQRKVIEELAARAEQITDEMSGRTTASIFRLDSSEGKRRTEDMAFFADIRDLRYDVLLDTTIQLGHIGTKEYTGDIMSAFAQSKQS